MGILTRYLIRAHAGPFFFALTALTGLLFLNAFAQRLQDLMGKGLTADVILDFMLLSLPHTVALTLPMAVLVSVLYAFSDLAASNELTAMKAGGIPPQRLLVPLLGVGTIVALLMFLFNDRVLPESNHQLKNLMMDIGRKSPTLTFREQVVNTIDLRQQGQRWFLSAERIDNAKSALYGVEIVDPNNPMVHHRILADSGVMVFNAGRTDLYLTLFDGVDYESSDDPRPGTFRQIHFGKQIIPLRGVGTEMERQMQSGFRGEREMTTDMLAKTAEEKELSAEVLRDQNLMRSREAVRFALGYEVRDRDTFASDTFDPGGMEVPTLPGIPGAEARVQPSARQDHAVRRLAMVTRSQEPGIDNLRQLAQNYRLEIHKKYSLAVACIVFVLIGAPLAARFPRGGLGMVIAVSSGIFAVYWAGLIGGENLSDSGRAPHWLGMWLPNVLFTALGLLLVRRMGKESSTMRGGGWEDLFFTIRQGLASPFRRARGHGRGAGG